MSGVLTTSKMITTITRRALIPTDQNTFTDKDFIDMINEEIQMFGVPHLLATREEYLVVFEDFPLVTDQDRYPIPYRAVVNKLREVQIIDSSGTIHELHRIGVDDKPGFNINNSATAGFHRGGLFTIENNEIVLNGPITESGSIRMYYYLRPNEMVEEKRAGKISTIDRISGTITVDTFPSVFSNLSPMDFVAHRSPNKIYNWDKTPTSVNANTRTIVFDVDDIPSQLIIGDYLNLAQETTVPQLPVELHPVLAQRVAIAALEALGDSEGVQVAAKKLKQMERAITSMLEDRVEGAPQKVLNRHSPIRQGGRIRGTY